MDLPALHLPPTEQIFAADSNEAHRIYRALVARLVDRLVEREIAAMGLLAYLYGCAATGGYRSSVLLSVDESRTGRVSAWSDLLAPRGYGGLLVVALEELDAPDRLDERELGALPGLGFVVGSAGASGEPLVGMAPGRLRRELRTSRERLAAACGYEIMALCPRPAPDGRAFDGLVRREAARAGYRLLLEPGYRVARDVPRALREATPLTHRWVHPGDEPLELARWVDGRGLDRASARVRGALEGPRRMLRAWGLDGR